MTCWDEFFEEVGCGDEPVEFVCEGSHRVSQFVDGELRERVR
ncbi:hypothetical protein [Natrialba asiatica]|nr:hypothetical protein [Natrialba asiatica]